MVSTLTDQFKMYREQAIEEYSRSHSFEGELIYKNSITLKERPNLLQKLANFCQNNVVNSYHILEYAINIIDKICMNNFIEENQYELLCLSALHVALEKQNAMVSDKESEFWLEQSFTTTEVLEMKKFILNALKEDIRFYTASEIACMFLEFYFCNTNSSHQMDKEKINDFEFIILQEPKIAAFPLFLHGIANCQAYFDINQLETDKPDFLLWIQMHVAYDIDGVQQIQEVILKKYPDAISTSKYQPEKFMDDQVNENIMTPKKQKLSDDCINCSTFESSPELTAKKYDKSSHMKLD